MTEPVRILVAMGGGSVQQTFQKMLASVTHDYACEKAGNFDQAMTALTGGNFDCALIDADLKSANNVSVLERLQIAAVDTPIIMVRNHSNTVAVTDMIKAGAVDCLDTADLTVERLAFAISSAARIAAAERRASDSAARLVRQTLYDDLSELPNRALFFDRLDQVIALGRREQRQVAVLTMDLNGFKEVNATLGHRVGDKLLQEVAVRLQEVARDSDTVARLGGDEFAQIMPTGATVAGAIKAAERAIEVLRAPMDIEGHHLATGISIGIALFPLHGEDGATLMRRADKAMYAAKRNVTGYAVYAGDADDPEEGQNVRQFSLSGDLRHAIEQHQMSLNFQPKIDFRTRKISGVEALLRWNHPEHGFVSPEIFIPLAEQTGIIEQLTTWVIDAALKQHAEWADDGMFIPMAINLSPVTLHETEFPKLVAELQKKWNVASAGLILEITESAIMSDVARATDTVHQLHDMGIRISIDDFGTGYTSLSYIRRLPVSEIKVDKSFVLNMREVNDDAVIVRSIVELGHNLGLSVVAEGIEDVETWDLLSDLKCNTAQGYFISRPVSAADFSVWVKSGDWLAETK